METIFVVNLNSQEIHMWDVAGEWQKPLKYAGHKQHKYVIRSCFGGFHSAFIASGSENSEVLEDGKFTMKHTLSSHQKPVSFVAWSPDDTMLLTCGNVEVVKLWDVKTGACKRTFGDHGFTISSCAWFPDSKRLVCGSSD
ncbi:hypothetical protein Ancab_019762 [Ancistrocladus abbreviatus]